MNVRIYSPFFPYPASEGAFVVIAGQVEGFLAAGHSVELVFWKGAADISKAPQSARLKIINWSQTLDRKDVAFAKVFRVLGSLFSSNSSTGLFYYPPNRDLRNRLGSCDLAIYHHCYSYSWISRKVSTETQKVVHFHNIESDLIQELARRSSGVLQWLHSINAQKVKRQEARIAQIANEIWLVSPTDYQDYSLTVPATSEVKIKYKAPSYSPELFARRRENFHKSTTISRVRILFIGGLSFHPNHDSLMWLLTEVAPLLRAGGFKGEFQVIGGGASESLRAKALDFPFVKFLGFVPDLEQSLEQASLLLVPDLGGSGVRIKLLEGLASGIPTLANASAVERIHPELLKSPFLIQREKASDWAEFILALRGSELRKECAGQPMDQALKFDYLYKEFLP